MSRAPGGQMDSDIIVLNNWLHPWCLRSELTYEDALKKPKS